MERYLHSQQAKAIEIAAKKCGLDCHITRFERKADLQTMADKIFKRFFVKYKPVKRSFLYCDTLDCNFFFLPDGEAAYTYAGYADHRDATEEKIVNAFRLANRMRLEMEAALKEVQVVEGCEKWQSIK